MCKFNSYQNTNFKIDIDKFLGFSGSSDGKKPTCNAGDLGSIPGLGRSPREGKGYPLQLFWPGEFAGLYSPWGPKESDMTERLSLSDKLILQILWKSKKL